jgi:hypothetical protein
VVVVKALSPSIDFSLTMETVESAMVFSPGIWSESHRGGELSRYGGWPVRAEDEERLIHLAISIWENPGTDSEPHSEYCAARLAAAKKALDNKRRARLEMPWLRKQALRILDLKWSAVDHVMLVCPTKRIGEPGRAICQRSGR